MANICENKFYLSSKKNINKYKKLFEDLLEEHFEGEITYESTVTDEEGCIEGWFTSKWNFPAEVIEPLLEDSPEEDKVYFRCLSEEYGMGYVAMHIYDQGWKDGQYFDL